MTLIASGALGVGSVTVTSGNAGASTYVVNDCSGSPTDTVSLPYALAHASPGDTIDFSVSCPASTPIIVSSPMTVSQSLNLTGPGASALVVSGNNASQVLVVDSGVTASIPGITIEDASHEGVGGAIHNSGTLTITDCAFSDNRAPPLGNGGAIANSGTLSVVDSQVTGNGSGNDGGAIDNADGLCSSRSGTLAVTGSTFTNDFSADGGAIDNGEGVGPDRSR